jgi:uncharacterized protein (TIGR02147 family)
MCSKETRTRLDPAMADGYRDMLERQFTARCRRNPRYSRRAFARDLGLSPSQLTEVLHGESGLSPRKAADIAQKLGFTSGDTELFCALVEAEHARDAGRRATARSLLARLRSRRSFHDLTLDNFVLIAEWYHLAILELMKVRRFRSEAAWVARVLGIGAESAREAIERLKRLGLADALERSGGSLAPSRDKTTTPDDVPSQAVRSFHAQILGKASEALTSQSVEEREFGTLLLAVRQDQIETAKRLIRDFQCQFSETLAGAGDRDEVYGLAVQFFRLSDTAAGAGAQPVEAEAPAGERASSANVTVQISPALD